MCTSSSKPKEVANGHREPKSRGRHQADRQIQEEEYRTEVIAGDEGKVKYRLADGREFKSPSSAATAITGKAANGWSFWSVEADGAQTEPQELESPEGEGSDGTETQEQPPIPGFRRVPNQKGVEDGEVRWYCDACHKSFTAPVGETPESCPEGHGPDAGRQEAAEA